MIHRFYYYVSTWYFGIVRESTPDLPTDRTMAPPPLPPPLLVALLCLRAGPAVAILPQYELLLPAGGPGGGELRLHASGAYFGGRPPMGSRAGPPQPQPQPQPGWDQDQDEDEDPPSALLELVPPPSQDPFLCNEADGISAYPPTARGYYDAPAAVLVPRGGCAFASKALSAQRLGAQLVVVGDTLASRYGLRELYGAEDDDYAAAQAALPPTFEDVRWPQDRTGYDCGRGRAYLPAGLLSFDPLPYDAASNDPLLTGTAADGSLCALGAGEGFERSCPSLRCLLTGRERGSGGEDGNDDDDDDDDDDAGRWWDGETGEGSPPSAPAEGALLEACCAWDVHMNMGGDSEMVFIPALFVTMEQYALLQSLEEAFLLGSGPRPQVLAYERWYPSPNASTFLLWLLGVLVTGLSSYVGAWEYREAGRVIGNAVRRGRGIFRLRGGGGGGEDGSDVERGDGGGEEYHEEAMANEEGAEQYGAGALDGAAFAGAEQSPSPSPRGEAVIEMRDLSDAGPSQPAPPSAADAAHGATTPAPAEAVPVSVPAPATMLSPPHGRQPRQDQHLDINVYHVAVFVVFASSALFILFFFKIYRVVTVFYALGSAGAMAWLIFDPAYRFLARRAGVLDAVDASPCPKARWGMGALSGVEIASFLSGYAIAVPWLYLGFSLADPHENAFYWIVQDLMGATTCVAFLSVIRLNSIKIATVLLVAVFVYDIFMVFITPLITRGGDSVMVTVATSGGQPEDPEFCEKYPSEGDCWKGNPLPMLLVVPRINDYRGGTNLLGLGDIVLPGLLIAFAARLDEAKKLLRLCTDQYRAETGVRMARRGSGSTVASSVDDQEEAAGEMNPPREGEDTRACSKYRWLWSGYFPPLMVSYGIGLAFAYLAVILMQSGQPALLYLVPACLGTMVVLGWAKGELGELWGGSKRIVKCNRIVNMVRPQFGTVGLREESQIEAVQMG